MQSEGGSLPKSIINDSETEVLEDPIEYIPEVSEQSELVSKSTTIKTNKGMRDTQWHYKSIRDGKIPTPNEIVEDIEEVAHKNIRVGSCIAMLYLTGARCHEILPYKYIGTFKDIIFYKEQGLKVANVYPEFVNDEEWLCIDVRTEKKAIGKVNRKLRDNRNNSTEDLIKFKDELYKKLKHPIRHLKFLMKEGTPDYRLGRIIVDYIHTYFLKLDNFKSPMKDKSGNYVLDLDKELWTFTDNYLRKVLMEQMQLNPHALRHFRLKNLSRYENFSVYDLMYFTNWSSMTTSLTYLTSNQWAIQERFRSSVDKYTVKDW